MVVDINTILPVLATAITGAMGWLIKSYLSGLDSRLNALQAMLHRRDGQLDALLRDLRKNNEELTKVRYEVKAVWRFIDNSSRRATDLKDVQNG